MVIVIVLVTLLVIAIVLAVVARKFKRDATIFAAEERDYQRDEAQAIASNSRIVSVVAVAVFLVLFALSSFTSVPANNVGIVTWFGKPQGTIGSGIHFLAPWASVDNFDTHTQTLDLKPNDNRFKFQGGGGAGIESTVNWHVDSRDAVRLWQQYSTLDNVQEKLLTPRVKNALVRAFSGYTPEQAVDAQNLVKITKDVTDILREDLVNSGVQVNDGDVNLKNFELDSSVQDRINSIVKANADLERAKVTKQQASVDAATNKIRQQSLTSQALINQCLTTVNNWDEKKNGPLPATFNCGLGAGSSNVLVQGK